jgi:hypothetical protein
MYLPKKLLLGLAMLHSIDSAGHAETTIKIDLGCLHLKTLDRLDQLIAADPNAEDPNGRGGPAAKFLNDQIKSGECNTDLKIGISVRVDKRSKRPNGKTYVCIMPVGSSEPCQWVSSEVIK